VSGVRGEVSAEGPGRREQGGTRDWLPEADSAAASIR